MYNHTTAIVELLLTKRLLCKQLKIVGPEKVIDLIPSYNSIRLYLLHHYVHIVVCINAKNKTSKNSCF